ncbi:uroporphyrinogen-III synthase [Aurantimonas sp. A2-1-M11]|uniref:uroporphyrinogen-III synthase n=1 Tax=Aurantimonas sp. A2-1-M11 TaxID=3113712 RepID=UPI002F92E7DE
MVRILILREAQAAARTADDLAARGHEPLVLPLESSQAIAGPAPAGAFAGFAATSARAVPALAAAFPGDARPVFAVGERTGAALAAAGFPDVRVAAGEAQSIGRLAFAAGFGGADTILYAAGRPRTGTLETALSAAGVGCRVWEVYETIALRPERAAVVAALGAGPPDAVLLLSAGQAATYGDLVARFADLFTPPPQILALSARIAAALPPNLAETAQLSRDTRLVSLFERLD